MLFNPCEPCCGCYHANIPQYKCTSNYSSSLYSGKLGADIDWIIICSSGHILDRFSCSGVRRFDMDYVLSSGNDYFTNPQYTLPTWLGQPIQNMSVTIKFPCLSEETPFVNESPLMHTMLSTPSSPNTCGNININPILSGFYHNSFGSGYITSQEKQYLQFSIELGENSNNYYLIDSAYNNFPIKPPLPKNSPLNQSFFNPTGIITHTGIVANFRLPDLILTNVSGQINSIREFTYELLPVNYYIQPIQTGTYTQLFQSPDSSLLNKCNYIEDSNFSYNNGLSFNGFSPKNLNEPYKTQFNQLKNKIIDNLYAKMIIRTNESGVQIHSSGCKSYGIGTNIPSELWITTIFSGVPVTLYYQCNAIGRSQSVYVFNKPFVEDEPVDSNPRATSLSAPLSFYLDNTGNIVGYNSADQDGIYSQKKNPDLSTQDGYDYNDKSPSWIFASGWFGSINSPGQNFKEFCGIDFKKSRVFINSLYDYPDNYYESEDPIILPLGIGIYNPITGGLTESSAVTVINGSGSYVYRAIGSGSYISLGSYQSFSQRPLPFNNGCAFNNHYINILFGLNLPVNTNFHYRNLNKITESFPGSNYYETGYNYVNYFSDPITIDNPTLEKFYVRIEYSSFSNDYNKNKFLEANVISFPCARGESVSVFDINNSPLIYSQGSASVSGIDYKGQRFRNYNTGFNLGVDFRYFTKDRFMYEHKDGNILSNTLQSTTISDSIYATRLIKEYQKYVFKNIICDLFNLESSVIDSFKVGIIRWNKTLKYYEILDQKSVSWTRSGYIDVFLRDVTTIANNNYIELDISNAYLRPGESINDYQVALISNNMPVGIFSYLSEILSILDQNNTLLIYNPLSLHIVAYG